MTKTLFAFLVLFLSFAIPAQAGETFFGKTWVISTVSAYYEDIFAVMGLDWQEPDVAWINPETPYEGECGTIPDEITVALFCRLDHTVALDESLLDDFRLRDQAIPFVIVAHEYAHHVQTLIDLDYGLYPGTPDWGEAHQVQAELQADCISGSFLRAFTQTEHGDANDLAQVVLVISEIADPHPAARGIPWMTHGSKEQRVEALLRGYEYGVFGCLTVDPFRS